MQLVIFHFFYAYGLKRAQPDVQRDLGNFDPASTNAVQYFSGEVQTGRRRRHRSPRLSVDSLIALAIRRLVVAIVLAVNVGRKRHVPDALDAGEEIVDRGEADAPLPETAALRDQGFECGWVALWTCKVEFFPNPNFSPGPHQALPLIWIVRHMARQQNFDPPMEKLSCRRILRAQWLGPLSAPVAVEAGWEHPCIVHDQQVVGPQQVGELAKAAILRTLRPIDAQPVQVQKARSGAVRQWLLGNAFGRQIILEVRDKH